MTDRLNKIFSVIPQCESFSDVGCDHGYIAKAMLDSGKTKLSIISDVSKACLTKAERLLDGYVKDGRAKSFVSDGFDALPKTEVSLVAGMGGEEIIKILSNAQKKEKLSNTLVLQPMKNVDKVRIFICQLGYKILTDVCFCAGGKFYDLIVCTVGKDCLTPDEIEFGRTNILERSEDFLHRIEKEICTKRKLLSLPDMDESKKSIIRGQIERLNKYGKY